MAEVAQRNHAKAGGNVLQLVSFKVGHEEFGLEILKVQQIIRLRELKPRDYLRLAGGTDAALPAP